MKIQKFNESNLTNFILEEFVEDIMEYFYPNETGSMGIYFSKIRKDNKKIFFLEFQFLTIDINDLKNILKVYDYCKSFDSSSIYYIYAEHVDDELDAACFVINIDVDKYDVINNDIKIKLKSNKYNL
jgi:hypothetical protein